MIIDIIFLIIFLLGINYLLKNFFNLKKAAEISKDALFPNEKSDYGGIIVPYEWKEMIPLSKKTKSYQYVKWGTIAVCIVLIALLWMVLATDWLDSSYFTLAYVFFWIFNSVKHRGNLFILEDGLILNGKFYHFYQIKDYEIEKIVRWHSLYGLDDKINNAYKLTFKIRSRFTQPQFVIVQQHEQLEKITSFLNQKGIPFFEKEKAVEM
ncbi:hypothetical protein [Neobacillus mesonae]|uniref:hypothetical protein n=1 Tax=Neobacillus mesonae TaxID=1193713 RepID=UPI00203D7598|nr:hypothetical protein [Neobacillus mesonae]MCM3567644.1 hypothetical protein [Neobacillus mesonae]